MGKSSAPAPDPRIGEAALRTANLGEEYLRWMQGQSAITTGWANEDRARYQGTFQPIENRIARDALDFASPQRMAQAAHEARGDVRQQGAIGRQIQERNLTSMGVNPASGRFAAEARRATAGEALAVAGAGNLARRQTEAMGAARLSEAANLGRGFAVNPATSMGISNNSMASGFQGAMNGNQAMGGMLNEQFRSQLSSWQAQQSMLGGIGQGIGSIIGALPMMSSKDSKTKKKPVDGALDAVRGMRVEEWEYKQGMGDGGGKRHVGPYAEEFQKRTGLGDGRSISIIDAIGVTMRATQELADKVDDLSDNIGKRPARARPAPRSMSVLEGA